MKTYTNGKYKIATKASHNDDDVSRISDICVVFKEDDDNFYGNWITGFGLIDVKFPKSSTNDLNDNDVEKYHGSLINMCGFLSAINITGEYFKKNISILNVNTKKMYIGKLIAPIKVGKQIAINKTDGNNFLSSTIQSIVGDLINTKNSTYKITYED